MDKQREKLIELIHEAERWGNDDVNAMADILLANGVIVPPCKVGDEVFYIGKEIVQPMRVSYSVCAKDGMTTSAHCKDDDSYCSINCECDKTCGIGFDYKDIGKTVFFSREDAEKALKGGEVI